MNFQISFKDNWLNVNLHIDEPSNINWQNLTFHPCKRFMRHIISFLFALILIIASFAVVVYGKYAQTTYADSYSSNVDCNFVPDYSSYLDILSFNATNNDTQITNTKVNCYCLNKSETIGLFSLQSFSVKVNNDEVYPCNDWFNQYWKSQSLSIGIILVIPFINSIIIVIQVIITKFERNKTLTDDLTSNMYKCFVTQFLNTAVVIVLVNLKVESVIKWDPKFFILTGAYKDFNPSWYNTVGTTIILTMFINIFTPHLSALMFWLYYYFLRCCDTGCYGDKQTNKYTKVSYFGLYVGPEFRMDSRYAQVIII